MLWDLFLFVCWWQYTGQFRDRQVNQYFDNLWGQQQKVWTPTIYFITKQKKEKLLVQSAKSIIENNKVKSDKLLEYSFSENYINESANILELYTKTDTYFPEVSIIVKDTVDNSPVYLSINSYSSENPKDTIPARKQDYIRKTTKIEREYLETVFDQNNSETRYTSSDGNYELFYPYIKNNKKIVLYFSDYQRYGK